MGILEGQNTVVRGGRGSVEGAVWAKIGLAKNPVEPAPTSPDHPGLFHPPLAAPHLNRRKGRTVTQGARDTFSYGKREDRVPAQRAFRLSQWSCQLVPHVFSWRTGRVWTHKESEAKGQPYAGLQGYVGGRQNESPKARNHTARTGKPNFTFDDDSGHVDLGNASLAKQQMFLLRALSFPSLSSSCASRGLVLRPSTSPCITGP